MSDNRATPYTEPGITLNAIEAMRSGQQDFTRDQAAYLFAMAYEIGRRQSLAENLAETIAGWDGRLVDDGRCTVVRPTRRQAVLGLRNRRKAARLAEYERISGPPKFHGGLPEPVSIFPAEGRRPPFPTLQAQAAWLSPGDVAYLKGETRRLYAEEQLPMRRAA